jgi:hypothetical protein
MMRIRGLLGLSAAVLLVSTGFAQSELFGYHQYPQYRGFGALPGSGYPIRTNGHFGHGGALTLSTPVAYTPTDWRFLASAVVLSNDMSFHLEGDSGDFVNDGSGTLQLMTGFSAGDAGSFSGSMMVLSSYWDTSFNLQWAPGRQTSDVRWAVGVQDLRGGGGASGTGLPGDLDASTSWYGVLTYEARDGVYLSAGSGSRRFEGAFVSASAPVGKRLTLGAEYDAFNINVIASYQLGPFGADQERWYTDGRAMDAAMFIGVVRGKYLTWGGSLSF